jgi:hypothetical protein
MNIIMVLCIVLMAGTASAQEAKEESVGNKGYIYGSAPVESPEECPQGEGPKSSKHDLVGDFKKFDNWIQKHLW